MSDPLPVSFGDVEDAARRIAGVAHRTPVLVSRTLDAATGASVFVKAENLQRCGAFKFRGAYNKLASLGPDERRRGVVAFSSGNHGQAVALAARLLGIEATIVMPEDAPAAKLDATRGYGARVVLFDRYADDREAIGRRLGDERGLTVVPPFDDPLVMAGQGTATLELVDDVGALDVLVVPVSGGGLAAGAGVVMAARCPGGAVVGVEPEDADDTRRSLIAGRRVAVEVPRTIADGLGVTTPGELTFEVNRRRLREVVTVSDAELVDAMVFLFDRLKTVAEPSGAAGVAALLSGRVPGVTGKRVGVILSGGNVGAGRFADLVGRREAPPV
ncbi:MAG TPA: pyridoxal-phosphate dependent enzyme [Acidimicrobiales bacterium]|nr:pyridoxal-phosphate dependent enzyme [Acidimicrobiales bacterium]